MTESPAPAPAPALEKRARALRLVLRMSAHTDTLFSRMLMVMATLTPGKYACNRGIDDGLENVITIRQGASTNAGAGPNDGPAFGVQARTSESMHPGAVRVWGLYRKIAQWNGHRRRGAHLVGAVGTCVWCDGRPWRVGEFTVEPIEVLVLEPK
jgi:hypothetical protein